MVDKDEDKKVFNYDNFGRYNKLCGVDLLTLFGKLGCFINVDTTIHSCIDVTFEMRTGLNRIHLFIDNIKLLDSIFILNRDSVEESRIAERQRESVCERQRIAEKKRWRLS